MNKNTKELIIEMLKDYRNKLEVDDYDMRAVDKMKAVNNVLDELQKGV